MRTLTTLALLLLLAAPAAHAAKNPQNAADLYAQGLRQLGNGSYTKALESFNRVRNYHRDDPVSVKAQLAIADLHYRRHDFEQAKFAYEEFAKLHPRHDNLDYVTWRIGQSIYRRASKLAGRDQSATRSAVNVWTGYNSRFPESKHGEDVDRLLQRSRNRLATKELQIARYYQREKAWGAVRGRTEQLVRRYPDTEPATEALAMLGTALHAWGNSEEALSVRERLIAAAPDSSHLRQLDRALARPAGTRPDDNVFVRPYRIRGLGLQDPAAAGP